MSCLLTIDELLNTTASVIAALDISEFAQDGYNDQAWHETRVPGSVIDGGSLSHLTFACIAGRSLNTDGDQDYPGESAQVRTPVTVSFTYHIRTGADSQLIDERLAQRAALTIVQALMRANLVDRLTALVSPWFGLVSDDGEWLLVTTEFEMIHDLPL